MNYLGTRQVEPIPRASKQVYNAFGLGTGNANCQIDTGSARVHTFRKEGTANKHCLPAVMPNESLPELRHESSR
jgi:hypothetical protein